MKEGRPTSKISHGVSPAAPSSRKGIWNPFKSKQIRPPVKPTVTVIEEEDGVEGIDINSIP